jgi:hypothetical protein
MLDFKLMCYLLETSSYAQKLFLLVNELSLIIDWKYTVKYTQF